ncbi:hypothetical protein [Catalinimonas niigatensis]|uniref:hypothetical protein n=1 Tax=Catalinimonas niigatensis TaxID=1397264 RepID=UPI0026658887|nr:hypothetical protein [Catalinimonas niigatensis]WPP51380.1 hypothetical protein PZB72_03140 [Catalinimonas niigatensis]
MGNEQNKNISKSSIARLIEFFHAIRIVFDSKQLINKGKYYQVTTIYGQLRALLTDKTKERNKEKRPLFEIASLLGEEIKIFYTPSTIEEDMPNFAENIVLHVSSLPISIKKQSSKQVEIKLEEYLNVEIVKYKGKSLKTSEIINALSDKYGGSHYDTKVPDYLMELVSYNIIINNQPILDNLIIQIADLFIEVGLKLIKKLSDFELFLTIIFKKLSAEENFIFDYVLPNSSSRISLYCSQGKIKLYLSDLIGRNVNIEISEIIKTKELLLFNISHRITNELKSEIKIHVNGINVLEHVVEEPLFMYNEVPNYQRYFNRSQKKQFQEFEFGLGEINMIRGTLNKNDIAFIYSHFSSTKSNKIAWFNENSYGHTEPGTSLIKTEGKVILKKIPKDENGA